MFTAIHTNLPRQILVNTFGFIALLGFGVAVGFYNYKYGEHLVLMLGTPLLIPLGLLLFVNPRLLFYVLVGSRCALDPILETGRFSSNVGLGAVLNLLLIACAVIICIQSNRPAIRQSIALWVFPLLIMVLGVGYAPDTIAALKRLIAFVSYFSVFIVGMILTEEKQLTKLLRIIVFSSVIPLTVGLYQFAAGAMAAEGRLASTFTHPNIFAFYCLLILIVLLYLQRIRLVNPNSKTPTFEAAIHWVFIALLLVSVILTQTRSAWVALILMSLVYGAVFSRKTLIWTFFGLILAALTPAVQDRIIDLFSGNEVVLYGKLNSFAWRQYIWESGLNWMSPSRYLTGYGIGGFYHYSPDFFPLSGGRAFGAHNVFVERFFDGGLLAVGIFAIFFLAQIRKAVNMFKHDRFASLIYLGLILSYLTLNASDNVVDYLAYNWYYWVVAGGFYAMATQVHSNKAYS